jgi:hypothetical protein
MKRVAWRRGGGNNISITEKSSGAGNMNGAA